MAKRSPILQKVLQMKPSLLRCRRQLHLEPRLAVQDFPRLMPQIVLTVVLGDSVRTVVAPTIGRLQAPPCSR
jgi:hypothetical protein